MTALRMRARDFLSEDELIAVRERSNLLPVGPQDSNAELVLLAAARLGG